MFQIPANIHAIHNHIKWLINNFSVYEFSAILLFFYNNFRRPSFGAHSCVFDRETQTYRWYRWDWVAICRAHHRICQV